MRRIYDSDMTPLIREIIAGLLTAHSPTTASSTHQQTHRTDITPRRHCSAVSRTDTSFPTHRSYPSAMPGHMHIITHSHILYSNIRMIKTNWTHSSHLSILCACVYALLSLYPIRERCVEVIACVRCVYKSFCCRWWLRTLCAVWWTYMVVCLSVRM